MFFNKRNSKKNNKTSKINFPTEEEWIQIHKRFDNVESANKIVNDFLWTDYYGDMELLSDSIIEHQIGIKVFTDKVKTKRKEYKFDDYNLAPLNIEGTKEFAFWLADFLPKGTIFHIHSLKRISGYNTNTYYYETPGGHLGVGGLQDTTHSHIIGYQIYVADPSWAPKNNTLKEW